MNRLYYTAVVILLFFIQNSLAQTDPLLLGVTSNGGENNTGTIYSLTANGTDFKIRHSFDAVGPYGILGGVTHASDGMLYGVSNSGGNSFYGTIYKVALDGTGFEVVHHFDDLNGARPYAAPIEGSDGKLYGTTTVGGNNTVGVIYSIDTNGSNFSILHHFSSTEGEFPFGVLLEASDGSLYGMTNGGGSFEYGTLFKINKDGTGFVSLHSFDNYTEGRNPYGGLIEDTTGALYGTLWAGGPELGGSVFKIQKDGTGLELLKTFPFSVDDGSLPFCTLLEGANGKLYGNTNSGGGNFIGVIFSLDKNGDNYSVLHEFAQLQGRNPFIGNQLIETTDGKLIGTTRLGGTYDKGVIYEINIDGTGFNKIHEFNDQGANPHAGVLAINGKLIGSNSRGGSSDGGVLFSVSENGTGYETLHDFSKTNSNGFVPSATPILVNDEWTYGSTREGGNYGFGTVYRLLTDGSSLETIFHFDEISGANPNTDLLLASNGLLFGTALNGGEFNNGTIFQINPGDNTFQLIHTFSIVGELGAKPRAGLIEGSDGKIYGVAQSGGNDGFGTIFRFDQNGSNLEVVHHFSNANNTGRTPSFKLIENINGQLYGVTIFGGSSSNEEDGTIFKINKDGTNYTVLKNFSTDENGTPAGPLNDNNDGYLYGVTENGGNNLVGTIYRISLSDDSYETIHQFDVINGVSPRGSLLTNNSDGWIYGVANRGGNSDDGIVYRIRPDGSSFEKTIDFNGLTDSGSRPEGGLTWLPALSFAAEFSPLEGIAVSPNPTNGPILFSWNNNFPIDKNATLKISDENGKTIYAADGNIPEFNLLVNQNNILNKSGIYFINLIVADQYFTEKIIVKK
ncbi:MAG: choice-of-anchor tandem repeat GloVer-containing protein [Bacteroidota bacterium]